MTSEENQPRWLAEHEAAHAVAGWLLGRRILAVSIRPGPGKSRAWARIARLRNPQSLEEGLAEITIDLVADALHGWQSTPLGWAQSGVAETDEDRAFDTASKIPGVDWREWRPIVELGRARARVLLEREDFRAAFEALVPALLKRKVLGGAEVEEICREAIAELATNDKLAAGSVATAARGAGDLDARDGYTPGSRPWFRDPCSGGPGAGDLGGAVSRAV